VTSRIRIKPEFRSLLSDKLMDLGNFVAAALVFGQFVSGREFSMVLFGIGISLMVSCYLISYIVSF